MNISLAIYEKAPAAGQGRSEALTSQSRIWRERCDHRFLIPKANYSYSRHPTGLVSLYYRGEEGTYGIWGSFHVRPLCVTLSRRKEGRLEIRPQGIFK